MLAFPPDFLMRKFFGQIAQKSAETVHLHLPHQEGNQVEKLIFYAVV